MKLLKRLINKRPSPIQISDWLANMIDEFVRIGQESLEEDNSSHNLLVYFTLINTTQTAYNLLHTIPRIAESINYIYLELRAYFDCLWQLFLLKKYESLEDKEKISRLAGTVFYSVDNILIFLMENNPQISRILSETVGNKYVITINNAIINYIQDEPNALNETDNIFVDNIRILIRAINNIDHFSAHEISDMILLFGEATQKALALKLVTQFDLENCFILPDEFFE